MPPVDKQALPFVTRDMLAFKEGTKLDLEVLLTENDGATYNIIGATREAPFTLRIDGNASGAETSFVFGLSDLPIFLTMSTVETFPKRGYNYARIFLRMNGTRVQKLCAGFVTYKDNISWPIVQTETPVPGLGARIAVTPTTPAAGAEWSRTFAAGSFVKINAITFRFVTAAIAATRQVHVQITDNDGATVMHDLIAGATQITTLTRDYYFQPLGGTTVNAAGSAILGPLPQGIYFPAGSVIKSVTDNIQATDQYSAIVVYIETYAV